MDGGERAALRLKPRARRSRAQATLEFAVVAPLFFLCFLAAVDAGLWAVQNSAEVATVEAAARMAASAGAGPLSQAPPDARAVTAAVAGRLRQGLFGTTVVPWCGTVPGECPSAPCPATPADVEALYGPRVVALCVHEDDMSLCPSGTGTTQAPCADSPMITVRLIGFVAALVPPGFGPGANGGELPADVATTTHTLRFSP